MNERIRQLKQQAKDFYLLQEDLDCSTKQLHELVESKFAELIVRECAGLMDGRRVEYGNCKDGRVILKHFGVEE